MLKTTGSFIALASRVDNDEVVGGRGAIGWSDVSKKLARSKSRIKSGNSNNSEEPMFLTSKAKEAFNQLRQAFTKAPIFQHLDPEYHIRIKTDESHYAIGGVLSQLTPNQVTLDKTIGSNVD